MRFGPVLPLAAVAAAVIGGVDALADVPPPPVLATVSPAQVVENGKPIRLVITGYNLSGVNAVVFAPQIRSHTFTVLDDQVVQVVLPATTAPGAYTIRVLTPGQGSDPAADLEVVVDGAPPPPSAAAAPVRPKYSFDPAPGFGPQAAATHEPATRPAAGAATVAPQAVTAPSGIGGLPTPSFNAAIVILAGLLAGGLGYALWGSAGRLATVRRTGFLAQLIGRPGQRLRLAHVCPGCGGLHWRWTTRNDLWRLGDYCSVGCLVDHGDDLIEACYAHDVASSRLHGMARLEAALDAEAAESVAARQAYLPRLLGDLDRAEPEERLSGQPMAGLLPAPELVPLPPALSG